MPSDGADATRRTQEELERLVQERTASLRATIDALAREVEHRRQLEATAHRHERALRTLGASSEALLRAGDERTLLEEICRVAVEVGGYRMAWVGWAERDERRTVRPAASWGDHDGYVGSLDLVWTDAVDRGRGPVGTAIRTGRTSFARRIDTDPHFATWRERARRRGFASMIALPVVVERTVLGALAIYSADFEALADDREVGLLENVADNLALGIHVLRGRAERAEMRARLIEADRLAVVGTLAAGIAHEINNPLVYLLGGLEFLEQQLPKLAPSAEREELRTVLGEMRLGGDRIRHIVRDLRTFARCGDEVHAPADVRAVADSSLQMAAHEVGRRARIVRDYAPVPPVLASEARLGQVLLNLLVNAAHAIGEEAGEIRVATRTDGAGRAAVEVTDTGAGIPPEVIGRIFEPFFTTKPQGVGTGLGLWISRNIVRSLGGDIEVETAVGRGTTFRVLLPPAPPPAQAAPPRVAAAAPAPSPRARVLVVDDDPLVATALQRALEREHEVVVETRAAAALARLLRGERYDAVICDVMMPDLTGAELHERAAQADPAQASRILFVTGGAFAGEAVQYIDRLPNRRLDKPFEPAALLALVREVVGRAATP